VRFMIASIWVVCLAACQFAPDRTTEPPPTPILLSTIVFTPKPTHTVVRLPSNTPNPTDTPSPTLTLRPTDTPEPTQISLRQVVVAVQPIPAGFAIPPEAVALIDWPLETGFSTAFSNVDDVINEVALVDIGCFQPIVSAVIARREVGSGFETLPRSCPPLPTLTDEMVNIAVPQMFITTGTEIRPAMVTLRAWPAVYAPSGAINNFADVVGAIARIDLFEEYPILTDQLTAP